MKSCIYCGNPKGETRDHIPPRRFFAEVPPANLITVPCCLDCQKKDQANDEECRNIITSLAFTESNVPKDVMDAKHRAYEYTPRQLRDLQKLQRGVFFDLNYAVLDAFLERVMRALLFKAFRMAYFPAKFVWKQNFLMLPIFFNQEGTDIPVVRIGKEFAYIKNLHEVDGKIYLSFCFYQGFYVSCELTRTP